MVCFVFYRRSERAIGLMSSRSLNALQQFLVVLGSLPQRTGGRASRFNLSKVDAI